MDIFMKILDKLGALFSMILPGRELIETLLLVLRVITAFLFLSVVIRCFVSLKRGRRSEEPVIFLEETGSLVRIPVLYWENSLGREKTCDITVPDETVSRDHAVLMRRESGWIVTDTGSKGGTFVNHKKITQDTAVLPGDIISIGHASFRLMRAPEATEKKKKRVAYSAANRPAQLFTGTVFVFLLLALQLCFAGEKPSSRPLLFFAALFVFSEIFYLIVRKGLKRVSFELETIGLLLSGTGVLLMLGVNEHTAVVQLAAAFIGVVFFALMIAYMENLERVTKFRLVFEIGAILLFVATLIFGSVVNGAQNWIYIGPISVQPSELIKVAFIFAGASSLNKLQTTKNLTEFLLFSALCIGFLFFMHDFGSAVIFFFTFLVIAFMRSGSIRTVILVCAAALLGLFIILKFKPYVAQRFAGWGHVWEYPYDSLGYQQTRVLTYSASGGLFGTGVGKGFLKEIFAGESDLVFGMLCEEMGLIVAVSVAVVFLLLVLYTLSDVTRGRSTFYSISSCSAAGLLLFQTCVNIFGSTDIFPLTGVTLPFISAGGSSMVAVWGLLAFIKASDERTYAARRRTA